MKTAFEIKEEQAATSHTHLLLEVAQFGISVLKFRKDPFTIDAVSIYNFQEDEAGTTFVEKFREVLTDTAIGDKSNVHVFYNFKESLLIPAEFMQEVSSSEQLNLMYGISPAAETAYDEIAIDSGISKQDKMFCVFRIPRGVRSLTNEISSNSSRHSTSQQIRLTGASELHCTIFHNTIKVFLYSGNQLLLVQQFGYKTPADAVYHLLNVCDKHDLRPGDIDVYINGMIDSGSSLYQELYKYFLHLHFNVVADDIFLSSGIKEHPLHFITHLTELARCV